MGVDELYFKMMILDLCNPPTGGLHGDASVDDVRSLAYTVWSNNKQVTTRDIHQKFLTLVMTPIKQYNDRLSNAIHCGVASRQVDKLMKQLADKTGVDFLILQDLVEQNKSVTLCKPINTMSDEDVMRLYGTDREQLTQLKYQKQKELETFIAVKMETLKVIRDANGSSIRKLDVIEHDNESWNEHFIDETQDSKENKETNVKIVDLTDSIAAHKETFLILKQAVANATYESEKHQKQMQLSAVSMEIIEWLTEFERLDATAYNEWFSANQWAMDILAADLENAFD